MYLNFKKIWIFLALAAAGWTQAAALSWPWGDMAARAADGGGGTLWALQLLGMAALYAALRQGHQAQALGVTFKAVALRTLVFVLSWLAAALWWLWVSLHDYGGLHAGVATAALLALVGFLSVYYVAAAVVWARWWAHLASPTVAALAFAALWTLAEMARGAWFTGFPWGAVGYAHVDGPAARVAPWLGVYGVGFVAVAFVALGVEGFLNRKNKKQRNLLWGMLGAICLILVALNWKNAQPVKNTRTIPITLLQANIAQDEKFIQDKGVVDALMWYGRQLATAPDGMVIAPETAIALLPHQLPAGYWQRLAEKITQNPRRAAIVGAPLGNLYTGYTNSAVGITPQRVQNAPPASNVPKPRTGHLGVLGQVQGQGAPVEDRWVPPENAGGLEKMSNHSIPVGLYQYHKYHLVPFGEFIPPFFRWFVDLMHMPLGDFSRGVIDAEPLWWENTKWAAHVCYEDLFGEELAQRFKTPENAPDVLVNISNLAWFGNNAVSFQHLHISRMRALEFERSVLRATNTGATAVIDAHGRVKAMLAPFTRGVLHAKLELPAQASPLTPYARWVSAAGGLWPLGLGVLLLLAALAWAQAGARRQ